jgi:ABC-2 type transport system ATP-binding protein/lipopolysaccharide transport system ATP-binding protein
MANLPLSKKSEYIANIEEFTELGRYLTMPTRIYSAGMQARLFFAIATMHAPDILLIDEGIGAGDAAFEDKVEKRVKDFTDQAKILVLASHAEHLLKRMCNKGVVLNAGKLEYIGSVDDALAYYAGLKQ